MVEIDRLTRQLRKLRRERKVSCRSAMWRRNSSSGHISSVCAAEEILLVGRRDHRVKVVCSQRGCGVDQSRACAEKETGPVAVGRRRRLGGVIFLAIVAGGRVKRGRAEGFKGQGSVVGGGGKNVQYPTRNVQGRRVTGEQCRGDPGLSQGGDRAGYRWSVSGGRENAKCRVTLGVPKGD